MSGQIGNAANYFYPIFVFNGQIVGFGGAGAETRDRLISETPGDREYGVPGGLPGPQAIHPTRGRAPPPPAFAGPDEMILIGFDFP